jgi:NADPH:quinone reductase-like Zn-dependent oxidoreductase
MGNAASSPSGRLMRAAPYSSGERVCEVTEDYPAPNLPPPKGEKKEFLRVRVRAVSLNPADFKIPKGIRGPFPGLDFAGEVLECQDAGGEQPVFRVGDAVFGNHRGTLADEIVVDAANVWKKPDRLSWPVAAAMPTAYLTGLQALTTHGRLGRDGKVLVIGASGGCGLAAVQVCFAGL